MASFLPVTTKGDSNAQLRGLAAVIRMMPSQVQPRLVPLIAAEVESTRAYEEYVHVNAVPKARKWTDERVGGVLITIKQTITNDTYEVSMGINADDWDDDQIHLYEPVAMEMLQSLLLAPDELITTNLIVNANSINCFDGTPFYGTAHVWPNGEFTTAQVNSRSGTGVTSATVESDFYTALNAMQSWKDDRGRLRIPAADLEGQEALVVHYPVGLNQVMKQVFGSTPQGAPYEVEMGSNGAFKKSTLTNRAITISDAYLSDQNDWYIHSIKGVSNGQGKSVAKPFVFQNRQSPTVTIFAKGSEHTEKYNEVLILGKRRFGLGVLRPERSQRIVN